MKKIKHVCFAISLSVSFSAVAEVCIPPQELHERKMNKFSMPSLPSLLRDCGLDKLFDLGGFAKKIGGKLGNFDLLCGYTTNDVASWYGVDNLSEVGVEIDISVPSIGGSIGGILGDGQSGRGNSSFDDIFDMESGREYIHDGPNGSGWYKKNANGDYVWDEKSGNGGFETDIKVNTGGLENIFQE